MRVNHNIGYQSLALIWRKKPMKQKRFISFKKKFNLFFSKWRIKTTAKLNMRFVFLGFFGFFCVFFKQNYIFWAMDPNFTVYQIMRDNEKIHHRQNILHVLQHPSITSVDTFRLYGFLMKRSDFMYLLKYCNQGL